MGGYQNYGPLLGPLNTRCHHFDNHPGDLISRVRASVSGASLDPGKASQEALRKFLIGSPRAPQCFNRPALHRTFLKSGRCPRCYCQDSFFSPGYGLWTLSFQKAPTVLTQTAAEYKASLLFRCTRPLYFPPARGGLAVL